MTRVPRRLQRSLHRPAVTLLEVVIAMTIFLFSVVAIMELTSIATDRALDAEQQAIGSMLAKRKIAELSVGATPLSSTGYTNFTEDGMEDWQWKVDATQHSVNGLWNVQVAVKYDAANSGGPSAGSGWQMGGVFMPDGTAHAGFNPDGTTIDDVTFFYGMAGRAPQGVRVRGLTGTIRVFDPAEAEVNQP